MGRNMILNRLNLAADNPVLQATRGAASIAPSTSSMRGSAKPNISQATNSPPPTS